ncbi:hypothetical protein RP20_CCG016232 [Aedes albopictus]|nr:hypothetical protein RP20_CCG016232 [Aedes albopictus]
MPKCMMDNKDTEPRGFIVKPWLPQIRGPRRTADTKPNANPKLGNLPPSAVFRQRRLRQLKFRPCATPGRRPGGGSFSGRRGSPVYVALFKPLRVSRHQFKKVLNCMKLVRSLKYQEIYAQEKVTKVDSLSLVLSGKLVVSQNQKALHIVFPHQFLDSPEWFGVSTDDYFQVSIMAMEESRVLIWHRDKLKLSIMAEPFLQAVFDHILGRDVVKKLMQVTQVSETMAQSNGYISSGYGEDAEDKPMLVMKNSKSSDNGGHGITALINRQLQDESVPLLLSPSNPTPLMSLHMRLLHSVENKFIKKIYDV